MIDSSCCRGNRAALLGQSGMRACEECEQKLAIDAVARMFESADFLTFDAIEKSTGLSKPEVLSLKYSLQKLLGFQITSRVDLKPPGLFVEA